METEGLSDGSHILLDGKEFVVSDLGDGDNFALVGEDRYIRARETLLSSDKTYILEEFGTFLQFLRASSIRTT